jgi:3-hydroxyisobutyrate dehydrogenase-like beta-hydroxyacid dehydrogenase
MSTNAPALIRKMRAEFKAKDVAVLDAPVSGLLSDAHEGPLTIQVGGDRKDYDRAKLIFETLGDDERYMGESGAGMITRIVHNQIAITTIGLLAEGLTLGAKAGGYGEGKLLNIVPSVIFPACSR